MRAIVVLPQPGGPYSKSERGRPFSTTFEMLEMRLCCPDISFNFFGRNFSESGTIFFKNISKYLFLHPIMHLFENKSLVKINLLQVTYIK
jgi:hypothetical protein